MLLPPTTITATPSPDATWQFTSDFKHSALFSAWISSDGRGSISAGIQPKDTGVPTDKDVEILMADTPDGIFHDPCSTAQYTGDATEDLSCIAQAAVDQGFDYAITNTGSIAPPAVTPPPRDSAPPAPSSPSYRPCGCR